MNFSKKNCKHIKVNIFNVSKKLIPVIILTILLVSCSKDDDSVSLSSQKQIFNFQFLATDNAVLPTDITATIDESTKTIQATVPSGTDITDLMPSIETSAEAVITPLTAQDFSSPITYTVTAQDASTVNYEVIVEVALTQREVLIAIFNANPGNTLSWDINSDDISTWEGVTTDGDGNVTELRLGSNLLTNIPAEIGNLTHLTNLGFYDNNITTLPAEIGNLTNLTDFFSTGNNLLSIPPEIGNLTNLSYLYLDDNNFSSIPAEIGNLTNLIFLGLYNNNLSDIPSEIGNLTNLTSLGLESNNLSSIPSEISNLTNLTDLYLNDNNLSSVPAEIGNLINLTDLYLDGNNLTTIPQSVCDLETIHGTNIVKDVGVTCL